MHTGCLVVVGKVHKAVYQTNGGAEAGQSTNALDHDSATVGVTDGVGRQADLKDMSNICEVFVKIYVCTSPFTIFI